MSKRFKGTVKSFNARGGFGFIQIDGSEHSVFVDHDALGNDIALAPGERVEVAVVRTPRGPRAGQVIRVGMGLPAVGD